MAVELAAGQAWAAERLGYRNWEEGRPCRACPFIRPSPSNQGVRIQLEEFVIGFRHDRPTRITPAGVTLGLSSPGATRHGEGSKFCGLDPRIA